MLSLAVVCIIIMIIAASGVVYLFVAPSGCPKCGFFNPCSECNERMTIIDEKLDGLKRRGE